MNVVIDTSTIIRATMEQNRMAQRALSLSIREHRILMTDEMAKELAATIIIVAEKKGQNPKPPLRVAATYLLRAKRVCSTTVYSWCCDPDDSMFIECAIDGGAQVVVSNDGSLTKLQEYVTDEEGKRLIQTIEFLTPEEFVSKYSLT
ncbi:putative nucleic acid-binding protein [Brevibacillus aydinogluensis]|jgi:predicted nucleic acid-binding protein|uniref:PIN domain-containing protein n=1 Tax=Brevibacillus aydinogluensis TaxID=927786 RepID=UPI00289372B9|nr:PIN domain-containing protein [Brevibacillus aydinogluensis]MDT3417424.1 putative nucleic acid-binding protein [Brevibacillus aydinogluensis]